MFLNSGQKSTVSISIVHMRDTSFFFIILSKFGNNKKPSTFYWRSMQMAATISDLFYIFRRRIKPTIWNNNNNNKTDNTRNINQLICAKRSTQAKNYACFKIDASALFSFECISYLCLKHMSIFVEQTNSCLHFHWLCKPSASHMS